MDWEFRHDDNEHVHFLLHQILRRLETMATQQDLDNAIAGLTTQITTLGTDLTQAISDLEAKIAASPTPLDFSAEVASLQGIASGLTSLTSTVTAADPGAPAVAAPVDTTPAVTDPTAPTP
jgi:hypothetical protein